MRTGSLVALLMGIVLVGVSPASADLATGLAGLWTFENGSNLADDTSPYNNDGTVVVDSDPSLQSQITQGPGVIGNGAADFFTVNGGAANHYIDIPNAPQLNGTSETVSYWIKTTQNEDYVDHVRHSGHFSHKTTGAYDVAGGWAPIVFDSSGNFGDSFKLQSQGGNNLGVQGWDGFYIDGNWHHIVSVYDENLNGGTVRTWIDGKLVVDMAQSHAGPLGASTKSLKLGGYDGDFGGSLIGSMDQVRIYNMPKSYQMDAQGNLIGGDLYDMWTEVPEPSSLMLLSLVAGAGLLRRR